MISEQEKYWLIYGRPEWDAKANAYLTAPYPDKGLDVPRLEQGQLKAAGFEKVQAVINKTFDAFSEYLSEQYTFTSSGRDKFVGYLAQQSAASQIPDARCVDTFIAIFNRMLSLGLFEAGDFETKTLTTPSNKDTADRAQHLREVRAEVGEEAFKKIMQGRI
jgi:hypothetical protein